MRSALVAADALVFVLDVVGPLAAGGAAPRAPPAPLPVSADEGAFVSAVKWLDSRMADLQVGSPAVGAMVPVRVLLPRDWSADADRTWPVLYLLQGAHDDYTSWTRETPIEAFTADKELIVA